MKTTTNKILLPALVIFLLLPSLAFASWWNPLLWLGNKSNQIIQPAIQKASHQDVVVSQLPVVVKKQVPKVTIPIINTMVSIDNNNDRIKAVVMELIQQYLSPEELEKIRNVTNHTTASYDPDKVGLQLAYIPGSMIADDGTYFSATNLSSSSLTTDEATMGSISSSGNLSVEGNANLRSANVGVLEVGSSSESIGITIYDTVTHEPFCVSSENGSLMSTAGRCN